MTGVELAWQQPIGEWFGASANYTYSSGDANDSDGCTFIASAPYEHEPLARRRSIDNPDIRRCAGGGLDRHVADDSSRPVDSPSSVVSEQ